MAKAKAGKGRKKAVGKTVAAATNEDFRCFIIEGQPDKRKKCYKNPTTGRYDWKCEDVDASECVK